MDFGDWWTTTFGVWEWSNFWSFIGVAANVGLGYIAIQALRAARTQATAADLQTQQLLKVAEEEKEINRRLMLPSIYPSIKGLANGYSLMIVNGSQYPIVIEGIRFLGPRIQYPLDVPLESFLYSENPVITAGGRDLRRVIRPGDGVELMNGSHWEWNVAFNHYVWEGKKYFLVGLNQHLPIVNDEFGNRVDPDTLDLLDGNVELVISFAYVSPEAKSYELYLSLGIYRWPSHVGLESSEIRLWNKKKIFANVVEGAG